LNLTLGEPLSLVKKLPFFDDPIELDVLLMVALHLGLRDLINYFMFNPFNIELFRGQFLELILSVEERWKVWVK
jgi:hypothetical protein